MPGFAIDTLIFDLDNTLIDRNKAMRLTMVDWLREQANSESEIDKIMLADEWGYNNRTQFFEWLFGNYGNKQKQMSGTALMDYFFANIVRYIIPDPLVIATLKNVAGRFQIILATNGNSITQRAKLDHAQLISFFHPQNIFISAEMGYEKPDKQFFEKIIDELRLDPAKTISIGDNPANDIKPAAAVGLHTCWVSHGRKPIEGFQADIIINDITSISKWNN